MNAENPVQIDLFGVSATRTKDTRLAEHKAVQARLESYSARQSGWVWVGGCAPGSGARRGHWAACRRRVSQSCGVSGQPVLVRAAELVPVVPADGDDVGAAVIGCV